MWPMKPVPCIFQVGDAFVVEKFWIRSSLTIVRTTMSRSSGGRVKSLPPNLVRACDKKNLDISHPIFGPSLNGSQSKKPQHSCAMPRFSLNRSVQIRPTSWRDFVQVIFQQSLRGFLTSRFSLIFLLYFPPFSSVGGPSVLAYSLDGV